MPVLPVRSFPNQPRSCCWRAGSLARASGATAVERELVKRFEVAAENTADCAGRADRWNVRRAAENDVSKAGGDAARQIEEQEPRAAHRRFDVVAEDPQIQHVPSKVHPAAMEEHGGEKGRPEG